MNRIEVQTALGKLVAYPTGDACYPGIAIELIRSNGKYTTLAVIEVNQIDDAVLQMHRWEEDVQEGSVDDVYLDAEKVEKMLNGMDEREG